MSLGWFWGGVLFRWLNDFRTDSSGSIGLAGQGTVLAEARTRPFEVLALNQYTAVRMLNSGSTC